MRPGRDQDRDFLGALVEHALPPVEIDDCLVEFGDHGTMEPDADGAADANEGGPRGIELTVENGLAAIVQRITIDRRQAAGGAGVNLRPAHNSCSQAAGIRR